jgi:hypothetical protein
MKKWIFSYMTHDVSPGSDMTPLWIPQLTVALGTTRMALPSARSLAQAPWVC